MTCLIRLDYEINLFVCFLFHAFDFMFFVINIKSDVQLSGKMIRSFKGHTLPVLDMCYDPTGTLVATGSTGMIRSVDELITSASHPHPHPHPHHIHITSTSHLPYHDEL